MPKYGLLPKTEDTRDLKLGVVYDLPKLEDLPKKFSLGVKVKVKDQKNSDFCTAFASCTVSEIQEGVELSPEWIFAVGKMIEGGNPDTFGLELRTICKAHQKHGCIEKKDAPFSLENKDPKFLRRIENWDVRLFDKAIVHKKESYFDVKGPYDSFDDIRASMYKFKDGVLLGVVWSWDTSQTYINEISDKGDGHALAVAVGWDGDYLIVRNSWGQKAGKKGDHYIHRKVINHFVNMYGAYMFSDISPEKAREYIEKGVKADQDKSILSVFTYILGTFIKKLETLFPKDEVGYPPVSENAEKFYQKARSLIGFNLAPGNERLGCAISMSAVHNKAFPELPPLRFVNTTQWYDWMMSRPDLWEKLDKPEANCVIVNATDHRPPRSPISNGHLGVTGRKFSPDGSLYIMSNNSIRGRWDTHWTLKEWIDYYEKYGGIETHYFRRK